MNWHHWYWWTIPAGIVIGVAWSYVLLCWIPPRVTTLDHHEPATGETASETEK